MSSQFWINNCPINEQTADGDVVGRCWFYLKDGHTCPRHGDVSKEIERYRETGKLTLERERRAYAAAFARE